MDRKTRICKWIIILGLGNFLAFVGMYIIVGGDALNGKVRVVNKRPCYLIQLRGGEQQSAQRQVDPKLLSTSRPELTRLNADSDIYIGFDGTLYKDIGKRLYIYSCVHSVLIWLTVAAVLLAMLTLAKDQLVTATEDNWISGRAVIHIFAAVVVFTTLLMTIRFLVEFIGQLKAG